MRLETASIEFGFEHLFMQIGLLVKFAVYRFKSLEYGRFGSFFTRIGIVSFRFFL